MENIFTEVNKTEFVQEEEKINFVNNSLNIELDGKNFKLSEEKKLKMVIFGKPSRRKGEDDDKHHRV